MARLIAGALIVALASAARVLRHNKSSHLEGMSVSSVPMYMYKKDCWKKRHWSLLQKDAIPGAGMNLSSIDPFQEVLKDGYYLIDCAKDYMLEFGDKHGKNKFQYNQGEVSQVSVVRYGDVVPRHEQEPMSHSVCFAFCRSVPDMLFFGIKNGRECYCAPYYQNMADDSSMCDAVCEGETTLMCGGKTKSSMFSMHSCSMTGKELRDTASTATEVVVRLTEKSGDVVSIANEMQTAAASLQTKFGNAGDTAMSNLMQSAKVFSGKLLAAAGEANATKAALSALESEASTMAGSDFSSASATTKAESLVSDMEKQITQCTFQEESLDALAAKAEPESNATGITKLFYPVMYFVDKAHVNTSTTCDGVLAAEPKLGSFESCAAACDALSECVGLSYTSEATVESGGLCFLFSKLKSAMYYTGCTAKEPGTRCSVKFAEFSGTTLKPDPSGKCQNCLKEATEAKRCYE